MESVNPATGAVVERYENDGSSQIQSTLELANHAFEEWRTTEIRTREEHLATLGEKLREDRRKYAELITREVGKPITQSVGEVEICADLCSHYAENAGAYLSPKAHPSPPGSTVKTVYDPLGPILAVMPWNYPFWQAFRFAVPYVTAGNVGILKHAPNVPGCALALEELFEKAGYPDGIFQSLLVESGQVADLISDDRIRGVTLTGSGPAGRSVAETAGKQLKKTVLELGGSDPFVVLDDADIQAAAETGAWARYQNAGQSCIAAKRFIVDESVYDQFLDSLVSEVESLTIGDPMDEDTDVGPLAKQEFVENLHEQVVASAEAGSSVVIGGEPLDTSGAYYPPTILTDIPEDCPVDQEEVFGPVAALYKVPDEDHAIKIANDTRFGLGASIWTEDRDRGERVSRRIDAGGTFVNQRTKANPHVPFGGVGDSGYGRELSEAGIKEFVNRKTVWIE